MPVYVRQICLEKKDKKIDDITHNDQHSPFFCHCDQPGIYHTKGGNQDGSSYNSGAKTENVVSVR